MLCSFFFSHRVLAGWLVLVLAIVLVGCNDHKQEPIAVTESKQEVSQETLQLHQIIQTGTLEDLQQKLKTSIDINAAGPDGKNALMIAIAAKDIQKLNLLLGKGADPELTDDYSETALSHAVQSNFVEGVRVLLKRGVDRGYHPKYPPKKIELDSRLFDPDIIEMPEGLKDVMTEEEWAQSLKETADSVNKMDQTMLVQPIIKDVYNIEILNLFLEAGDNLGQISNEFKRVLVGLDEESELSEEKEIVFQASRQEYLKWKAPRYGSKNPDRMDNPFWNDMIRIGCNAYRARDHFKDPNSFDGSGPVWCYDRFGSSLTELKDGRFVQIGGEHEDHYDPDFYIYNDVVLFDGKGQFQIFGYPKAIFPPTDFHSATLAKDWIYIIGCLGYPEQRTAEKPPVFRLKVDSWEMEAVKTTGDSPKWLFEHRARYEPKKNAILVEGGKIEVIDENGEPENIDNQTKFVLDLSTFKWRKQN